MSAVLEQLPTLERALIAKGWPAMTEWWRTTFAGFYGSARRAGRVLRQLVLRVGRRGGKSSSLCRIAVLEALFGGHVIAPGDVGVVAIISVSRDEAAQRLRTIRAVLDALGVKYRPIENGIELEGRPIVFKIFAASLSGVVGFTCICAICDEVAAWRDADSGANPATEVLATLRPTMAGQPLARIFLSSSARGMLDAHAVAFDLGETDFQSVAFAPTWVARPSLTEAETHELEPDLRRWAREYAAIPQAGALGCFDAEDIERAFAPRPIEGTIVARLVILDPSSGRKDRFTACRVSLEQPGHIVRLDQITAFEPEEARRIGAAGIAERLAPLAHSTGCSEVHSDQREAYALSSEFRRVGVRFVEHTWTASSKPEAIEVARRWFREAKIVIAPHETMRRELLSFEERIAPSGAFTFGARGNGHDDFVSLVITTAMTDLAGHMPTNSGTVVKDIAEFEQVMRSFPGRWESHEDTGSDWNEDEGKGLPVHGYVTINNKRY